MDNQCVNVWVDDPCGLSLYASTYEKKIQCHAILIEKNILHHSPTASGASLIEEDYELTFQLEDGKKRHFLYGPWFLILYVVEKKEY